MSLTPWFLPVTIKIPEDVLNTLLLQEPDAKIAILAEPLHFDISYEFFVAYSSLKTFRENHNFISSVSWSSIPFHTTDQKSLQVLLPSEISTIFFINVFI